MARPSVSCGEGDVPSGDTPVEGALREALPRTVR